MIGFNNFLFRVLGGSKRCVFWYFACWEKKEDGYCCVIGFIGDKQFLFFFRFKLFSGIMLRIDRVVVIRRFL